MTKPATKWKPQAGTGDVSTDTDPDERITEAGDTRVTEAGDTRVVEETTINPKAPVIWSS